MGNYLFRAEAVNLTPTVYDTSDISAIRGSGFYLLNRIHRLAENDNFREYLITEGASAAVFKINTDDPVSVRNNILEFLYGELDGEQPFKEMMFLVEYLKFDKKDNFREAMAGLMGKLRLSQMQSPTVRIFQNTLKPGKGMTFDGLNRVLPAHTYDNIKEVNISDFTHKRKNQGKPLRKAIYKDLLRNKEDLHLNDYDFTDSLEELSVDPAQGNLSGKIAYIHIDGNKFGALQSGFSEVDFREYDLKLQGFKKEFLSGILKLVRENRSFLSGKNKVRLETLLWGGDELKLVVPAWLGWKTAQLFFKLLWDDSKNMKMKLKGTEYDLTYAMGLVLSHHKNPIRNISAIGEELVSSVKDSLSSDTVYKRAEGDRMYFMVLESLETLQGKYSGFCREYYGTESSELMLSPKGVREMQVIAKLLNRAFPRSRVYRIAAAWRANDSGSYTKLLADGLSSYAGPKEDRVRLAEQIKSFTGTAFDGEKPETTRARAGYRWLQLAELWDYLVWEED